jgi:4-diphosphocytidyl-2-C-methyl-D-erythritol kinase
MVGISWQDTVFVEAAESLSLVVTGRSTGVPVEPEKNLAGRAALALAAAGGVAARARITLHKVLPHGGGIGGGSSDAASTLLALNAEWELRWPVARLAPIAASLGSDIPFFLEAVPSLCTGRGEIMTPLLPRHPLFAVLIVPPMGCPTKAVYQAFDAGRRHEPARAGTDWQACAEMTAEELNCVLVNDLESAAFLVAPGLESLRDRAARLLGRPIQMTGSGSTLFTLCGAGEQAEEMSRRLQAEMKDACASVAVGLHV